MQNVKAGDIYEVETQYGYKEVVILAVHGTYATTLGLSDTQPRENSIAVKSRSIMYADLGKPGYAFDDKLGSFIKALPEEEFSRLLAKFVKAVGYQPPEPQPQKVVAPVIVKEPPKVVMPNQNIQADFDKLRMKLTEAATQRDVYKSLYEEFMKSLIGRE